MFGIRKITLTGITNDDFGALAQIAALVGQALSDAPTKERLLVGRLIHTGIFILEDIEKGKTIRLTVRTVTDLHQLMIVFRKIADKALAVPLATGSADPELVAVAASMVILKAAADRILWRLTELLREDAKLR